MLTLAQGGWNAGAGIKHNAPTLCAVAPPRWRRSSKSTRAAAAVRLSAACGGRIMGAMFNARRTGLAPRAVVASRLL